MVKSTVSLKASFYGLPKLHKPNIPLRPIVSSIGSPTYNLSKELARILSPLRGKTTSYIKNSSHFVEMIKDRTISESDLMVSFDVKSLFTRVPIKECLEIAEEKLNSDDTLGERTTMTPSSYYYQLTQPVHVINIFRL